MPSIKPIASHQSPKKPDDLTALRARIAADKHTDEHCFIADLIEQSALDAAQAQRAESVAAELVDQCRADTKSQTLLDAFLQEYGLSNHEGVALMCLAEALLRVPDRLTANRMIAEKLGSGDWWQHIAKSDSWLVNASTWGLVLTGKIVALDPQLQQEPQQWWQRTITRLSAPVVRLAVLQAMRLMGGQYVLGRDIDEGIRRGQEQDRKRHIVDNASSVNKGAANDGGSGLRFSFDMLGEGARTMEDAERYYQSYSDAFDRVGELNVSNSVISAHGVSVKLSALHPQYHFAHYDTVMRELLPKITALCVKAKNYNIGLSIDAEEAARLDMSLDIFQALCDAPALEGWRGLGFVMQAYQKRAPAVAEWLVALAESRQRTIMVRLVKGAYWDAEIKHAQEQGLDDYPVFTRKVNTDVCYLHCAKILLQSALQLTDSQHADSPGAVFPQFATHNAHTTVAVSLLAEQLGVKHFEFQRLHGMGELLYKHAALNEGMAPAPLRIYAPIGRHRDLLPYLVRRLLENGANSSFVNRFLDHDVPPQTLVQDCYQQARAHGSFRHTEIPTPRNIFETDDDTRINALGFDLDDANAVAKLKAGIADIRTRTLVGHSIVAGEAVLNQPQSSLNPSLTNTPAGEFHAIDTAHIEASLEHASTGFPAWSSLGANARADILANMADLLEEHTPELVGLINREAGRTIDDCVSEVREAVDFCRYYGDQAVPQQHRPAQGVFLCISPWNFPLAIFTGQISAALAAGNCVLAKPADPTPIIATRVTQLFHQAGVPTSALHLLIGDGPTIGEQLLPDPRLGGVAFTGSTAVANTIHKQLSQRPGPTVPFIAETGGQNCMVVDSTALPEQVVDDVIASAFHSAGQRCSALRVLYVQDTIADRVMTMLEGALALVRVGAPCNLATDVGPIIDASARAKLQTHIDRLAPVAKNCLQAHMSDDTQRGNYFAPRVFEIDSISQLEGEVFGPVLHVIRFNMANLDAVIDDINNTGYALTFGVHSRISAFADYLFARTHVGNVYINRNTIGAVVGVNPFGGRGLSGTGPKAGGPSYLLRYQNTAKQGNVLRPQEIIDYVAAQTMQTMPGPTGELNELSRVPLGDILLILDEQTPLKELSLMCCLALALGNTLTFTVRNRANRAQLEALMQDIPTRFHSTLRVNEENLLARVSNKAHVAAAIHLNHPKLDTFKTRIADREGAITPLICFDETILLRENLDWYISQLSSERTKTDNLVAKGGNTQLFNLSE